MHGALSFHYTLWRGGLNQGLDNRHRSHYLYSVHRKVHILGYCDMIDSTSSKNTSKNTNIVVIAYLLATFFIGGLLGMVWTGENALDLNRVQAFAADEVCVARWEYIFPDTVQIVREYVHCVDVLFK